MLFEVLYDNLLEHGRWQRFQDRLKKKDDRFRFYSEHEIGAFLNSRCLTIQDVTPLEEFNDWLTALQKGTYLGFDYETRGTVPFDGGIVGLGLSDGKKHFYLGVTDDPERWESVNPTVPYITQEQLQAIVRHLVVTLECVLLVYQGSFEWGWTRTVLGVTIPHDQMIDVMVLDYLLTNKTRKLAEVANEYLDRYPISWKQLVEDHANFPHKSYTTVKGDDSQWIADHIPYEYIAPYCAEDALECVMLYPVLLRKVLEKGLQRVWDIDRENVVSAAMMTYNGMLIDRNRIIKAINNLRDSNLVHLYELKCVAADDNFNPNSPQQLSKLIFEKMGVPTDGVARGKTGYSTNKDVLAELEGEHPVIALVQSYRKGNQLLKTFVPIVEKHTDESNVIHTEFNVTSTVTGRWSTSNPNLLNIPNPARYYGLGDTETAELGKSFRKCFVARPGYVLIVADYPAMEFRILAHLSQDPLLLDVYRNKKDLHDIVTCLCFGLDRLDKSNQQHLTWRTVCKTINFGAVYGMGAFKLQRQLRLYGIEWSLKECEDFMQSYWQKLSGVRAYFDSIIMKSIVYGYVETMIGRKRYLEYQYEGLRNLRGQYGTSLNSNTLKQLEGMGYLKFKSDQRLMRQCQNFPMQGSNADATRTVINQLSRHELKHDGSIRTLLQVYDELVVECKEDLAYEGYTIVKTLMENAIQLTVPLVVEPKICESWGDAK